MAKKPEDRFDSGEAMAAALRAWAPTANPLATPVATQPPAGLPTSVWEWVTETVGAPSPPTIQPAPAPSTLLGNWNRLSTVIADRFGPKWKAWAYLSAAVLALLIVAAMLSYFLRPSVGAVQSTGPTNSGQASAEEKLQDEIVNSIGMKLKLIKPGTFLMGSPKGEASQIDNEQPQHSVEITRSFYLGVYPVTQAEYVQVTGQKNPSACSNEGVDRWRVAGLDTSRFPVEQVSWDAAVAFCEALNRLEAKKRPGRKYTLPTEAEWEYACRAGSKSAYFFGSDSKELGDYAWYEANSKRRTHAVGTRMANPWGLCDMNGNVWQWCADWHDKDYYANSPNKDPVSLNKGGARVLRGGSWNDYAQFCRAAYRSGNPPGTCHLNLGFRVCFRLD
ncbi:MAG TPA: hypothetical protein DDY78_18920 [Planctomycetales bacterium]|jgi:formylglycine-generating enzyme required for sulfatase activity|nr:hypothetical protein [Planctomycetales bacterium]